MNSSCGRQYYVKTEVQIAALLKPGQCLMGVLEFQKTLYNKHSKTGKYEKKKLNKKWYWWPSNLGIVVVVCSSITDIQARQQQNNH